MNQHHALAVLKAGYNVVLTGAAGSGKTTVLLDFIQDARANGKVVAVTATTGLAATHLNGTTIHSWSGIGIHDSLSEHMLQSLPKQRLDTIQKTDILVIDEISMLHDYRLDMIDTILRHARRSERPFGGIQVVLSGDFFQLPPINRAGGRQGSFVHRSRAWQEADFNVCYLTTNYRQQQDESYAELLQAIRDNTMSEVQYERLQSRIGAFVDPFETVTKLYTTNVDVDSVNSKKLETIKESTVRYFMETTGKKQFVDTLKKSCLAPEVLELKKGAAVMCIKNAQDKSYVNGSLGTVVDFEKGTDYPKVALGDRRVVTIKPDTWELNDGEIIRASLTQLPLRLAWAITVHKSQGMTLDAAEIDLSKAFTPGMGYVALSRVKNLQNVYLKGMNNVALKMSPEAYELEDMLRHAAAQVYVKHARLF